MAKKKTSSSSDKKKHLKTITSTQNFSPIRDVRKGIIVTTDNRFIKLMEFSPINFDLRSYDEQSSIISQFYAILRSMGHTIQFKIVTRKADINSYINQIYEEIRTETNENCIALQREQVRLISQIGAAGGVTRRFFVVFEYEEPSGFKTRPSFAQIASELEQIARNISTALKHCGNHQISIDGDDEWTLSALHSIMCRDEAENSSFGTRMVNVLANYANEESFDWSQSQFFTLPVNDFISPYCIDPSNSPKHIIVDGLYYMYCYVTSNSYPIQASAGWPQIFMNLGEGVDVDIWVHKEDPEPIRRKLQYVLKFSKVKFRNTEDTNQDYDELAAAIQSGYDLKSGISAGDDFCYFGTMLTITAHSLAELTYRYNEIKTYCIRADLEIRPCNFQQLDAFKMTLPLCKYDQTIWRRMRRNLLLSSFASAYPFTSFEMSDADGILLGSSAQNGSLVFVNNYDSKKYSNANMTVLGPSGTGKTYTIQCMALRMRQKKHQVFIIAPMKGFEFRRACDAVGGQYIKIAPGSGQNINIMEIRKKNETLLVDGSTSRDESILSQKIQQLHTFFTLLIKDITNEEKQILDEALINTYNSFGITSKNSSLSDPQNPDNYKRMPILGDLHAELKKLGPRAQRIYDILTRYVTGSASSFNAQTNVNLNNPYIVMDVSTLTKEMLPIGMFIALDYVWDKARENRTSKKAIFVDETWRLIGPGSSILAAEFVLEIFKVIRGFGGAAIAATQDVNDFFALDGGRFGDGIINNSSIKLLLKPGPKEAELLRKILDLTSSEIEKAKMMEKGTALLAANENHIFINIHASHTEHDLITTDQSDLQRIEREMRNSITQNHT